MMLNYASDSKVFIFIFPTYFSEKPAQSAQPDQNQSTGEKSKWQMDFNSLTLFTPIRWRMTDTWVCVSISNFSPRCASHVSPFP